MRLNNMEPFYEAFGPLLREQRKRAGMSQGSLGNAVGLSRTSITNIEKGRQRIPLHLFAEVVRVLRVEPSMLLPANNRQTSLRPKLQEALRKRRAGPAERNAVLRVDRRIEREAKA